MSVLLLRYTLLITCWITNKSCENLKLENSQNVIENAWRKHLFRLKCTAVFLPGNNEQNQNKRNFQVSKIFKSFPTFMKIKEIMSYTREDALKLNDEKIKIEKVSFILDFDILLAQKSQWKVCMKFAFLSKLRNLGFLGSLVRGWWCIKFATELNIISI